MSEILIATESGEVPQTAEEKAKQLPDPTGYHILVTLPRLRIRLKADCLKRIKPSSLKKCWRQFSLLLSLAPTATQIRNGFQTVRGVRRVTLS